MEFSYYSLAIDESTDSADMSQLLVFVRGIDDNFNISEDLADTQSMQSRTSGKDICTATVDCAIEKLSSDSKNTVTKNRALTMLQLCVEKRTKRWLCFKSTLEERLSLTTAL